MKSSNLELIMKRLKEISDKIENDKINIDESIDLFEEGMRLTKDCREILENAELKVKKIIEENGKINLVSLDQEKK
ncbi:MAG: exodeoxyribonuclease VII small subunit [Candidatus Marinimicrobia bacterium]|nr:exodeoxyribonuclease VII small subunit [Candidatus Neomarinimicrobiota bacterium]|tara:strand:+ start:419 stop:646 length:228 start_codon:yes stop_codon:yes gene_type:complete